MKLLICQDVVNPSPLRNKWNKVWNERKKNFKIKINKTIYTVQLKQANVIDMHRCTSNMYRSCMINTEMNFWSDFGGYGDVTIMYLSFPFPPLIILSFSLILRSYVAWTLLDVCHTHVINLHPCSTLVLS